MSTHIHLTRTAAHALILKAQGLLEPPPHPATKADVLATIRRMGVLQIDSINIIARSPYLVLWSRLGAYDPRWLDELLTEGALFEYWSHAACFLPIEDYGLYRRRMFDRSEQAAKWIGEHRELATQILQSIADGSPVRSSAFVRTDGQNGTWWNWKPEKVALEYLFDTGDLMVARRENFQRVYDIRERILPDWNDDQTPSAEEVRRAHILATVRALGVAPARWIPDYYRLPKRAIATELAALAREGQVFEVSVDDWKTPAYIHPDNLQLAKAAEDGALVPTLTTLLSPFDPLVWDRARALELWDFHYRIEVYTPAAKRQYGYYTLPILRRGMLVGRLDPKAHRDQGIFEVRALHFEPHVVVDDALLDDLAETLRQCAVWHNTPQVRVLKSDTPGVAEALQARLQ